MIAERRIGAHLPVGDGLLRTAERAAEIGADVIQVFVDNPTAWRRRAEPPVELAAFRRRVAELGLGPIAVHAAYLINLAGPDPGFFERSVATLAADVRAAAGLGATLVNVHAGSHRDTSTRIGIGRIADGIARVLGEVDGGPAAPRLVLENAAGGGWSIGADIDELARLADAFAARGIADGRVGFCLDTAHLWGAGIAIDTEAGVDDLVARVGAGLGLDRIAMLHLNDSKVELGSHQDRHEHVGAGRIGAIGLAAILRHPGLASAPAYLETPGMDEGYDATNLARAKALLRGEALTDLPPEAFALRGSRARTAPAVAG